MEDSGRRVANYWYVWCIIGLVLMAIGGSMGGLLGTFVGIVGIVCFLNGITNIFMKPKSN